MAHLSGAERKSFCPPAGKKFCGLFISPWTVNATGCGCISPRRQGLKRGNGARYGNEQGPAATTERGTRNGVAPYSPAAS
ncbi:hypothetical protein ACX3OY_23205, partial [Citrobacter farmeri]